MIKALLLLVEPIRSWERIIAAQRGVGWILLLFIAPLLVITSAAEGYGLHRWGKMQHDGIYVKYFSTAETVIFEAGQIVIALGIICLGARLVKSLGETFHGRHTYAQTFTVVAYGLSPLLSVRLLDAFRTN